MPSLYERMGRYLPFDWLFAWQASVLTKATIFGIPCLFLTYGFLGMQDPFNVVNYVLIVPLYLSLGSTIVRDLILKIEEIGRDFPEVFVGRPVGLQSVLPKYIKASTRVLIVSIICLAYQLTYIYYELGLGLSSPKFSAFPRLFSQSWINELYPFFFFVVYICIQFFSLWFAATLVFVFVDIIKSFFIIFKKREVIYTKSLEFAIKWNHETGKTFKNCFRLSALVILNSFTYSANVDHASTANLIGFDFIAGFLVIIAAFARFLLQFSHLKYLESDRSNKPVTGAFPKLLAKLKSVGIESKIVISAMSGSLFPIGVIVVRLYYKSNAEKWIVDGYNIIAPVVNSVLGFNVIQ